MEKIFYTSREELQGRINRLQEKMAEDGVDVAVITGNVNLFYFAGSCQSGHLLIPAQGEAVYLVRKSLERVREESALSSIFFQESMKKVASTMLEIAGEKPVVGMELDIVPANLFFRYRKLLADAEIRDISNAIKGVRAVKSACEVEIMRHAAAVNKKMFEAVPDYLVPGIKEVEFAGKLEAVLRGQGHQGAVRMRGFNQEIYYGHLMSGENLTYPSFLDAPTGGSGLSPAYPQSAGWKRIEKNEPVMVDYVAVYQGYMVDQARIYCLGKLPDELEAAHKCALFIQEEVARTARPGVSCSTLFQTAFRVAEEEGFSQHFMGYTEKTAFIGHGIGLELDELPVIAAKFDVPLQAGMVFALEPKMFYPGVGVVGVENSFLVTDDGLEKLTFFPEEIMCF